MNYASDPVEDAAERVYQTIQKLSEEWSTQRIKIKGPALAHRAGIPLRLLTAAQNRLQQNGLLTLKVLTSKVTHILPGAERKGDSVHA